MTSPSKTELRIIRSIVIENLGPASPVLNQLSMLRFDRRNMTDVGYFLEFTPLPEALRADRGNHAISADFRTNLPPPRDIASFTLFIDEGLITNFEGYTYGEKWPTEPLEDWLVLDDVGAAKKKAK
jgi:hypothetical protein